MLQILRIERIQNFGVFRDFTWASDKLPDFSRRNLLYGWNYSGKTTFSRILQAYERSIPKAFSNGKARLSLANGGSITLNDLPDEFNVRVFNHDYIESNVTLRATGGAEPILLIGENTIDLQNRRRLLQRAAKRRNQYAAELEERGKTIRRRLEEGATGTAAKIRERFGVTPFNRRPHLERLLPENRDKAAISILATSDVQKLEALLYSEKKDALAPLPDRLDPKQINNRVSSLLSSTAQQETIERLAESHSLREWVETGFRLHNSSAHCHFCEQLLPTDLMDKYAKYFSDSYAKLTRESADTAHAIESMKLSLQLPRASEVFQDMRDEFRPIVNKLRNFERRINRKLDFMAKQCQEKARHIDIAINPSGLIKASETALFQSLTKKYDDRVRRHNERCKNLNQEKEAARNALIKHVIAQFASDADWWGSEHKAAQLRERWTENKKRKALIEEEIAAVDARINSATIGASEINRYLKLYFGKQDIEVRAESNDRFRLYRGDSQADHLSEGEKTAIAFAYFIVSLRENGKKKEDLIVFIDDPVSSLDANHVFNTFSIIKAELGHVKQLFVSTHDYGFFKLMRTDSFFREIAREKRRTSLYLISRIGDTSSISALPATLSKYNSEYHYLFSMLTSYLDSEDYNDADLWLIPNVTRRLLEIYTSFKIPNTNITLDQRLTQLCDDLEVAHRIYKFVNHYSHSDSMAGLHEFPQPTECRDVVKAVFSMIEKNDESHFEGMKQTC